MNQNLVLIIAFLFSFYNIYDSPIKDIDNKRIELSHFRSKKILFINVSSAVKYQSQYKSLQNLNQKYKDKLVIIVSPSNTFGNEARGNRKIKHFIKENYPDAFVLTEKIEVTGINQAPLYKWLTSKELNNVVSNQIIDDFFKFLVDENGNLIGAFVPDVDPFSNEVQRAIND